jgi:hypothetical protein
MTIAADRRLRSITQAVSALREIAIIAMPDTLLPWYRLSIARKGTYARKAGRRRVLLEIRPLVVRMAQENPTWGYTIRTRSRTSGIESADPRSQES